MSLWLKFGWLAIFLSSMTNNAQAGIVVGGTRVIYDGGKKETSISVINPQKSVPYLIQSWVEGENDLSSVKPPFIITPPLFRLDPGQENILRIVHIKGQLPTNKESVYWLSIKSIPSSEQSETNTLQISVKTRIKLFYRPADLPGEANQAYKTLKFALGNNQLTVNNPSPYYVSFHNVKVGTSEIKDAGMIAPFSTHNLTVPTGATGQVSWQAINDYGGISEPTTETP